MVSCNVNSQIAVRNLATRSQKRYYPVKIGEVFKDQYKVLAKLGNGQYSNVWLARDERSKQYTTLKICIEDASETSPIRNEMKMLQRMQKVATEEDTDHPGLGYLRFARDTFEIDGPTGRHICFVMKPEGCSVRTLQERIPDAKLPRLLVRSLVQRLLPAVNFLHASCGLIHTDVSPMNVLCGAEDDSAFQYLEEQEKRNPSTPAADDASLIYQPRDIPLELSGTPILTDFGQMRSIDSPNDDWWMPDLYRAPEVLMRLPWSVPVDVWSIGVMTLELMEGKNLFDPIDRVHNQYVLPLALAQYIGLLGDPPVEMICKSPLLYEQFDDDGNFLSEAAIPKTSLEDFVTTIPSAEEKELFLKFIRKMLTWDPEKRASPYDLMTDEWLMKPTEELMSNDELTALVEQYAVISQA